MNEPLRRFLEFSRWLAIGIFHNVAVALVDVHGAVGNHRIDVFLVNRLVRKGRIVPAAPPVIQVSLGWDFANSASRFWNASNVSNPSSLTVFTGVPE